jgi:type II secretory pathway component PulC
MRTWATRHCEIGRAVLRVAAVLAAWPCACARAPVAPPVVAAPPPRPAAVVAPAASAAPADHSVPRSAVHAVVAQGLGMFLRRVTVDDQPVFVGGRFHGFRIAALHDKSFWDGVDLAPGDVVVSVNGMPIERPEQALTVFDSLEVASELRVAFERGGQARELIYSIVDR